MDLKNELIQFGLSAQEARMYLAALRVGPASVQHIAQEAKMNRVSAYGIIEGLLQKGFLREERIKNKRHLAACSPTKLYDVISREFDRLKRKEKQLGDLVPDLKQLERQEVLKTRVMYYEGEEGMKNWASDALETKGELLEWTKVESFTDQFEDYLHAYYFPEKAKRRIRSRFIFLDTKAAHVYVEKEYMKKQAPPMLARFIPQTIFDTPGYTIIFNDRYSIALPKEMRAVTVVDQLVADSQRKIFEFGWLHATGEIGNIAFQKI